MKLKEVTVRKFKNILDSNPVKIEDDITCIVGKNESGKTAFLHSLYRLNPARKNAKLYYPDQYPAWLEKKDRLQGVDLEQEIPISTVFELEDKEEEELEKKFGNNFLKSRKITVERNYKSSLIYGISYDEQKIVKHFISQINIDGEMLKESKKITGFKELDEWINQLKIDVGEEKEKRNATGLEIEKNKKLFFAQKELSLLIWDEINKFLPDIFYYDDYSNLPYSVNIKEILQADPAQLSNDLLTARSLLQLAAADSAYLLNPDYERRKRELENVANALTDDVLKYWSQNPELRVQPDITLKTEKTPQGQQSVLDELKIRIWDQRHSLSLPFDEHSTGFRWFFSFLAAFSEYEFNNKPVLILLDEPALGLHAKAQADFLRFIEERLSKRCQVIYTTHSPFMVQPNRLERVRTVEDLGRVEGAKISQDILTTDPDTLFPLQGALGYDLVQHLFINTNNLIVEGTSDYTYLVVISDYFKAQGNKKYLDSKWSVIPVGGIDLIPTFVALLGNHLDLTVLVDAQKAGHQKLSNLASKGYLSNKRIITIGSILNRKYADIEDLFNVDDYLNIYNIAFKTKIKTEDLKGSDPIISKICRFQNIESFDHGIPADILLRKRDEILAKLSNETLDNFEKLFEKINSTMKKLETHIKS